ncbi:hypothetical protein [Aliikangiella sp. IMCC44359]|uniref:hypothetical protein n=1 Tax=Aliikangiella sp. IMCC44359 TaxID=3459125 RepID=UPI00403A9D99
MNSTIIIAILAVLFICVAIITAIQKREQQKAALRQKIAQYRYRANQASSILSNIGQLPIGIEARKVILQYSLNNLKAIRQLSPHDETNNKNIETLENHLKNPASAADKKSLVIPHDIEHLKAQINSLSKLAQYIIKLQKASGDLSGLVPVAVNRIMALIAESKICAYIQQGKSSLTKHEYVQAQRNFSTAQDMMNKIPNKNERITKLELDLQELINSTPSKAENTELLFNENTKEQQEDKPITPEDNLFGPKKKW